MKTAEKDKSKKVTFNWDNYDPEKFFSDTDRVAKVLKKVKDENRRHGRNGI